MSPSPEFDRDLHARLLAGDPTAPACLAETYLTRLAAELAMAYPHLRDDHLLHDAAADALLNYGQRPGSFDPAKAKGGLFAYLLLSARGDLKNALDKGKRRQNRESPLTLVEEWADGRNTFPEEGGSPADDLLRELGLRSAEELEELVQDELPDPTDRRVLKLMQAGVRRTGVFAKVLGLEGLELKQQEKMVKRHKDRIKARLKRLGEKIRAAGRRNE
jgi:hypothetical protein